MEKKQFILSLQLVLSFSNLFLLLFSISTILKIKDEVHSLKVQDFTCSKPSNEIPNSNNPSNHQNFQIKPNTANSISSIDYMHKDSGFWKTQLKKYSISQRKRLRIGVPMKLSFNQFDEFSVHVFQAAVNLLPSKFPYQLVPFNGSSDELLNKVTLKTFDAAVGDIVMKSEAFRSLELSYPYAEAQISMVVKARADKSQEPWLLFTLFTPWMWLSMAAMSVFTGFVIWFIEYQNSGSNSPAKSVSSVLWISLSTLYWGHRETPSHCLSHIVLGPWLLLLLVVSATFTSSLTAVLTDSNSSPPLAMDVKELVRTNSVIGNDGNPCVDRYLVKVLGFKQRNIRSLRSFNEYAKALTTGDIKAAFVWTPNARAFIVKYKKGFSVQGPMHNIGSFGFVFPKGSPLVPDISQAILRSRESGELEKMENEMFSSFNGSVSSSKRTQSLGPEPFLGLFVISGFASVIALLITLICRYRGNSDSFIQPGFMGGRVWPILFVIFSLFHKRIELQPVQNRLIENILQSDLHRSVDGGES